MTHKRYSQDYINTLQTISRRSDEIFLHVGEIRKPSSSKEKKMLGKITDLRFHHIHPLRCISQLIMFGIKQERKKKADKL